MISRHREWLRFQTVSGTRQAAGMANSSPKTAAPASRNVEKEIRGSPRRRSRQERWGGRPSRRRRAASAGDGLGLRLTGFGLRRPPAWLGCMMGQVPSRRQRSWASVPPIAMTAFPGALLAASRRPWNPCASPPRAVPAACLAAGGPRPEATTPRMRALAGAGTRPIGLGAPLSGPMAATSPLRQDRPFRFQGRKVFPRSLATAPWRQLSADLARRRGSAFLVRRAENRLEAPAQADAADIKISPPAGAPRATVPKGVWGKCQGHPETLACARLQDQRRVRPRCGCHAGNAPRCRRRRRPRLATGQKQDRIQSFNASFRDATRAWREKILQTRLGEGTAP